MRSDLAIEVLAVLHDAGDDQRQVHRARDRDRLGDALVRMDAAEEGEPASRTLPWGELGQVDAVVDGRCVVELWVAIGVADGNVRDPAVVTPIDRANVIRGEAVDRGHDRRPGETAVGEGQEVVVVMNEVEAICLFERVSDVKRLVHLRVERRILFEWPRAHGIQPGLRDAVSRREQGHVDTTLDQALREERDDALPRSVVPWRHAPRNGREHPDAHPGLYARSFAFVCSCSVGSKLCASSRS